MPERRSRLATFLVRAFLGHIIAYPVGFLAAIAGIPLAFKLREHAMVAVAGSAPRTAFVRDLARQMALSASEAAQLEVVLRFLLWTTLAVVVVIHGAVLPWAASGTARARRIFLWITGTTTVVLLVTGAAGWIWLYSL